MSNTYYVKVADAENLTLNCLVVHRFFDI